MSVPEPKAITCPSRDHVGLEIPRVATRCVELEPSAFIMATALELHLLNAH